MRLYLMPASGLNSKVVTTGPGIDLHHVAEHVELFELRLDADRRFPSVPARRTDCVPGGSLSSAVGGSR